MRDQSLWQRVQAAWSLLAGRRKHLVRPGRERALPPSPRGDEPASVREGFVEEAIPWMDAVHAFALRLTGGDRDDAQDLVQETFLNAHRAWDQYTRGSNAKSWLFTICRNAFLKRAALAHVQREQPWSNTPGFDTPRGPQETLGAIADPERDFFEYLIDDEVVGAIDGLPLEFREVLVLSDLGDLTYAEISEVLDIPLGTVKSRLSRGRALLQEQLRGFAIRAGYLEERES